MLSLYTFAHNNDFATSILSTIFVDNLTPTRSPNHGSVVYCTYRYRCTILTYLLKILVKRYCHRFFSLTPSSKTTGLASDNDGKDSSIYLICECMFLKPHIATEYLKSVFLSFSNQHAISIHVNNGFLGPVHVRHCDGLANLIPIRLLIREFVIQLEVNVSSNNEPESTEDNYFHKPENQTPSSCTSNCSLVALNLYNICTSLFDTMISEFVDCFVLCFETITIRLSLLPLNRSTIQLEIVFKNFKIHSSNCQNRICIDYDAMIICPQPSHLDNFTSYQLILSNGKSSFDRKSNYKLLKVDTLTISQLRPSSASNDKASQQTTFNKFDYNLSTSFIIMLLSHVMKSSALMGGNETSLLKLDVRQFNIHIGMFFLKSINNCFRIAQYRSKLAFQFNISKLSVKLDNVVILKLSSTNKDERRQAIHIKSITLNQQIPNIILFVGALQIDTETTDWLLPMDLTCPNLYESLLSKISNFLNNHQFACTVEMDINKINVLLPNDQSCCTQFVRMYFLSSQELTLSIESVILNRHCMNHIAKANTDASKDKYQQNDVILSHTCFRITSTTTNEDHHHSEDNDDDNNRLTLNIDLTIDTLQIDLSINLLEPFLKFVGLNSSVTWWQLQNVKMCINITRISLAYVPLQVNSTIERLTILFETNKHCDSDDLTTMRMICLLNSLSMINNKVVLWSPDDNINNSTEDDLKKQLQLIIYSNATFTKIDVRLIVYHGLVNLYQPFLLALYQEIQSRTTLKRSIITLSQEETHKNVIFSVDVDQLRLSYMLDEQLITNKSYRNLSISTRNVNIQIDKSNNICNNYERSLACRIDQLWINWQNPSTVRNFCHIENFDALLSQQESSPFNIKDPLSTKTNAIIQKCSVSFSITPTSLLIISQITSYYLKSVDHGDDNPDFLGNGNLNSENCDLLYNSDEWNSHHEDSVVMEGSEQQVENESSNYDIIHIGNEIGFKKKPHSKKRFVITKIYKGDNLYAKHFDIPLIRQDVLDFDDNKSFPIFSIHSQDLDIHFSFTLDHKDWSTEPKRAVVVDALQLIASDVRINYSAFDPTVERYRLSLAVGKIKIMDSIRNSSFSTVLDMWTEKALLTHRPMFLLKSDSVASKIKMLISLQPLILNIHEDLMNFIANFHQYMMIKASAEKFNRNNDQSTFPLYSVAHHPIRNIHLVLSPLVPIQLNLRSQGVYPPTCAHLKKRFNRSSTSLQNANTDATSHRRGNVNSGHSVSSITNMVYSMSNVSRADTTLHRLNHKCQENYTVKSIVDLIVHRWLDAIQMPELVSSLQPISSTKSILRGMYDVIHQPYSSWKYDGRPLYGFRSGFSSFNNNTVSSVVEMCDGLYELAGNVFAILQNNVSPKLDRRLLPPQTHSNEFDIEDRTETIAIKQHSTRSSSFSSSSTSALNPPISSEIGRKRSNTEQFVYI
ncbi:hypothetical protein GJ496_006968 [Pomphorhynchus laevis]|nr:hypothetical protein GJ496_006968 [Pomphorhynchus laevis]